MIMQLGAVYRCFSNLHAITCKLSSCHLMWLSIELAGCELGGLPSYWHSLMCFVHLHVKIARLLTASQLLHWPAIELNSISEIYYAFLRLCWVNWWHIILLISVNGFNKSNYNNIMLEYLVVGGFKKSSSREILNIGKLEYTWSLSIHMLC